MGFQRQLYEMLYRHVQSESELDGYSETMPLLLQNAITALNGRGKVLDIGCGTGFYASLMAKQGLQVTGLDFVANALQFAKNRSAKLGLHIDFIQADVTKWETHEKYDLILDSGYLHGINGKERIHYKEQILKWLADDASYVLVHFGKRNAMELSFHAMAGLKSRTQTEIQAYFEPELQLKEFYAGDSQELFFQYWFEKRQNSAFYETPSIARPAGMMGYGG